MYAYSRIKKVSLKRSKSLDLTNLTPHTPTLSLANYYCYNYKPKDDNMKPNITRSSTTTRLDPSRMLEQDNDQIGEVFGVILGRKYPSAVFSEHSSTYDKQRSSFHSAVKIRSFSMRRSTSIAEGYRRMNRCCCSHDLSSTYTSTDDHDLYQKNHVKIKRSAKLFKVCRSLFGL